MNFGSHSLVVGPYHDMVPTVLLWRGPTIE